MLALICIMLPPLAVVLGSKLSSRIDGEKLLQASMAMAGMLGASAASELSDLLRLAQNPVAGREVLAAVAGGAGATALIAFLLLAVDAHRPPAVASKKVLPPKSVEMSARLSVTASRLAASRISESALAGTAPSGAPAAADRKLVVAALAISACMGVKSHTGIRTAVALLPGSAGLSLIIGMRGGASSTAALAAALLAMAGSISAFAAGPALRLALVSAATTGSLAVAMSAVAEGFACTAAEPGTTARGKAAGGDTSGATLGRAGAGALAGIVLHVLARA